MDIFSIIKLLCGLTFFLFGMKVMSGDLEKLAGGKLEQLLKKFTANPALSMLLGAVITKVPVSLGKGKYKRYGGKYGYSYGYGYGYSYTQSSNDEG